MSADLADPAATRRWGAALGAALRPGDAVLLEGDLGAGKTSLVRAALHAAGWAGEVPSPTFPLVVEYRPPDLRLPVLHADLYRLAGPGEVAELGLDEADDAALLVEWPDRAGAAAWPHALRLRLAAAGPGRRLTWALAPAWAGRWPPDLR